MTEEAYDAIARDERALRPGVDRLLRELGADSAGAARFASGSLPVYAAGTCVLKLFPQVYAEERQFEAGVLEAVAGRLPIPTPRVHATGERDGWGYVLMDRVAGVPLAVAWRRINVLSRDRLADDLGRAVAALHRVPPPDLDDWWPDGWDAFVAAQRAGCAGRQRALGLPEEWLAGLPAALDVDLGAGPPVLLHTELMRDHLYVEPDPAGGWRYSGLIDFEPAMPGAAEYEFVGAAAFVSEGDARFLGRMLRAYGYRDEDLDEAFRARMMAWSLLHLYSNIPAWLKRLPPPAEPTFRSLAARWFGTG
ncbi:aminoglycoside phosphotransferase family protein [Paractinoplanes rishiriensis]|uniref:aminoglycoside phosphotransferase family protein n=1 Tax=Paractinoplanes rishiriensis TaxID=1050105 RepID=UPI00194174F0|nr:aminoglycoside 3'-phosphotransferase/choline kinase family protein [Actinoplanes rishiriensis]